MKILTVISNYNEEKEIENCIRDFREGSTIESDLLIIDNCSSDSSLKLIKKSGEDYLWHPVNTGGSFGVIKTSFFYSLVKDYDIYCHMDGDNQHHAPDLKALVEPILQNQSDFVIGSRFLKKEGFQSLFFRRMGIRTFSFFLSVLTGYKITDLTSGFRAYNRKAIEFFATYRHEYEPCVEMILLAAYSGLKVQEVSTYMKPRLTGKSEINLKNALKFPIFGTISIIGTLLQKGKLKGRANAI